MNRSKNNVLKSRLFRYTSELLICVFILGLAPQRANAADIDWTIAPYFWGAGVTLDVAVNNNPVIGADASLSDLLDKLDSVFMGHFEGRGNKFGAFVDTIYMSLSDNNVISFGPGGPILGDLVIDTKLTLELYNIGGIYRVGNRTSDSAGFDVLFGARLVDVEQSLDAILPGPIAMPVNAQINVSETDVFLGGRVMGDFTDRWHYKVRADFSAGGTDGTFNMLGAIGYSFGDTGLFSLDVGYRYMAIKLKNDVSGTGIESDLMINGPIIGFIFNF